jgi:hypothetical protein
VACPNFLKWEKILLGMFTQKESAIEARKQAEIIHFGASVA